MVTIPSALAALTSTLRHKHSILWRDDATSRHRAYIHLNDSLKYGSSWFPFLFLAGVTFPPEAQESCVRGRSLIPNSHLF